MPKLNNLIKVSIVLLLILISISLLTKAYGTTDIGDYANTAKFFAGKYSADLRTSHSLLYGFVSAPFVSLFQSFLVMKIINLICLVLIAISIYYITGKDKKALLLICASPIFWYMGPWINPISLSSLLFLWGFYFITKYQNKDDKKIKNLIYSGLLIGLSAAFWNTILIMAFFLFIVFFYNKNINHAVLFLIFGFIGLAPLLILDQILFGFMFFSIIKYFLAILGVFLYTSIYTTGPGLSYGLPYILSFILVLPLFAYTLYSRKFFKENSRIVIFLTLCLLFIFINPQIRYLLFLIPLILIHLPKTLTKKQFNLQLALFLIISVLIINPYIIQINNSSNVQDFTSLLANLKNIKIYENQEKLRLESLNEIITDYPNQVFIIGNEFDDYDKLAFIYWGDNVQEFVSIQDYNSYLTKEDFIFEKRIEFNPKIKYRRKLWFEAGISKSDNDDTDYGSIGYAISLEENINLENFELLKDYGSLSLFRKK